MGGTSLLEGALGAIEPVDDAEGEPGASSKPSISASDPSELREMDPAVSLSLSHTHTLSLPLSLSQTHTLPLYNTHTHTLTDTRPSRPPTPTLREMDPAVHPE